MNKKIFLLFLISLAFLISGKSFSQDINSQIELMDRLSRQSETSLKDAVDLYRMITGKDLNQKDSSLDMNSTLRRGKLSIIVAKELKLNNSLLFMIFKTERYAYKECVFSGIMESGKSTHDIISGNELLQVMKTLADKTEKETVE